MKAATTVENIIPLTGSLPKPKPSPKVQRFTVQEFENPRTGSSSWRVSGIKRDGTRVRQNFAEMEAARAKQIEFETEYLRGRTETAIRATKLSEEQIRLAEVAFIKLGDDWQMLLDAVDHWNKHGKQLAVAESPRLDDAFAQFGQWLDGCKLRPLSCKNLRRRVNVFVNSVPNMRVADVVPTTIEKFLDGRSANSSKSRDNDRRAVSRFFSWCIERPRHWTAMNPCREISIEHGDEQPPAILTLDECKALLKAAEHHKGGILAPYVAVCLFGGLRPFEASRLTREQVNLKDGEIRLEGWQTKTGMPRVVNVCPTLKRWLDAYAGTEFFPTNWRKEFDAIKEDAGFGTPTKELPSLKPWPVDAMRHTAISHYFRETGSYGRTAEQFGNSEAIIKKHYQGRVSSDDTGKFYGLLPKATR